MAEVHVRELKGWEEMEEVVALQREVWGRAESDLVPRGLLVAVQDEGGLVAGAFAEGRMVGFVFGFPTKDPALALKRREHGRLVFRH